MLGVQPFAYYCRVVGSDTYFVEEDMKTTMHPQVLLAWMLNDEPIAPKHGAPLRLIIPFRYGARSIKAVAEIHFTASSFPAPAPLIRGLGEMRAGAGRRGQTDNSEDTCRPMAHTTIGRR